MRLSPLYVSVHATEADLRIRLLKNPRAGEILKQLAWFQDRRLQIHAQVVLCPEINDGEHLTQTLMDLAQFHQGDIPAVASVAVVPVGLTQFRSQVELLTPVTPAKALEIIRQVQELQAQFRKRLGTHFAWLADEWFLIAGQPLPVAKVYEQYPQIDNGVGSIQLFTTQFQQAATHLPKAIAPPRCFTWVVGNTVAQAFAPIVDRLNQVTGLTVRLAPLASDYWGQTITVTGLLTGHDLLQGLQGQDLGDALLLPSLMLKHESDRFLDDRTVAEVAEGLQIPIIQVGGGPQALIDACLQTGLPENQFLN
jgi:putative radical SAM enzyme (TIGR03279 family)